jgi:hypothetical protein
MKEMIEELGKEILEFTRKTDIRPIDGHILERDIGEAFEEFKSKLPQIKTIGVDDPPEPGQWCFISHEKNKLFTHGCKARAISGLWDTKPLRGFTFDEARYWISIEEINKFFGVEG